MYHRFGASGGGPVRLPRIYDGRNKTFFFTRAPRKLRPD